MRYFAGLTVVDRKRDGLNGANGTAIIRAPMASTYCAGAYTTAMTNTILRLTGLLALCAVIASAAAAAPSKAEVYFRLDNPCPSSGQTAGPCKGYVIDRITPVLCGGAEDAANMQWQTLAQAKEKDRWERIGCRAGRKQIMPTGEVFTEAYPLTDTPEPAEVQAKPLE